MNILTNLASRNSTAPAIVSNAERFTYGQLTEQIQNFRERLAPLSGNQIALCLRQSCPSVALLLATVNIEARFILVPEYYPEEKVHQLATAYQINYCVRPDREQWEELPADSKSGPFENTQVCILTSGTTGIPKCVQHTWESLAGDVRYTDRFSDKKWYLGYPITHFAGLQVFLQCLLNGSTLLLSETSAPRSCYDILKQHRPHYFNATPTLVRQILMQYRPEHFEDIPLQHITLGGEVVDQPTIDLIKTYFPDVRVIHIYASSELGAVLHVRDEKEGFPEELVDGKKIKIENGELYVKKTSRSMQGYLGGEALKEAEWVATKDIVEVQDGRVIFCGRIDNIINVGGYKVHPVIVENTIREIPEIQDVVVTSASSPLVGHLVKAVLMVQEEDRQNELIRTVVRHCKEKLPYYMVPKLFDFAEQLETSKTHKKLR